MAGPQGLPARQGAWVLTVNRVFMLLSALLFALAALAVAFNWSTPAWAFGFGAWGAMALAWAL